MQSMYYIGLDVHKKTISYCVKDGSGRVHAEGTIPATRYDLDHWLKTLPQPWTAAMEATIFTGWIYDHLRPHAAALKVAHPLMLRAIAAAKKKNDRIDASKIADCLRCDFLPECYMAATPIRERRRTLRYRSLLVRQPIQMKNKIAVLLMEAGVTYNKQKLHKVGYFRELLATNQDIDDGLRSLLRLCRENGGSVGEDRERFGAVAGAGSVAAETDRTTDDDSRRGSDHGADLGAGGGRGRALPLDQEGHQLLRFVQRREEFWKHRATHAALQATQQASANDADRRRPSWRRDIARSGAGLRKGEAKEQCQSGDAGGGTEDGGLPGRGGPAANEISDSREPQTAARVKPAAEKIQEDSSARSLPGLAVCRLGEGAQAPEAHFEMFRDWQEITNSIFCEALRGRDSKWMSGSASRQEPLPRGTDAS